jgi:hypothetical protein
MQARFGPFVAVPYRGSNASTGRMMILSAICIGRRAPFLIGSVLGGK